MISLVGLASKNNACLAKTMDGCLKAQAVFQQHGPEVQQALKSLNDQGTDDAAVVCLTQALTSYEKYVVSFPLKCFNGFRQKLLDGLVSHFQHISTAVVDAASLLVWHELTQLLQRFSAVMPLETSVDSMISAAAQSVRQFGEKKRGDALLKELKALLEKTPWGGRLIWTSCRRSLLTWYRARHSSVRICVVSLRTL